MIMVITVWATSLRLRSRIGGYPSQTVREPPKCFAGMRSTTQPSPMHSVVRPLYSLRNHLHVDQCRFLMSPLLHLYRPIARFDPRHRRIRAASASPKSAAFVLTARLATNMPTASPQALRRLDPLRQRNKKDDLISDANIRNFAPVARIMKGALPDNAKIAKEAKECMQECVSEFISFITSEGKSFPLLDLLSGERKLT